MVGERGGSGRLSDRLGKDWILWFERERRVVVEEDLGPQRMEIEREDRTLCNWLRPGLEIEESKMGYVASEMAGRSL